MGPNDLTGAKSLFIGAFYRPPDSDITTLDNFDQSLQRLTHRTNGNIWLGGDFNASHINWPLLEVTPLAGTKRQIYQQLIDISLHHNIEQVIDKPTRGDNILDLFLTNNKSARQNFETPTYTSSVTGMLSQLEWVPLATHRANTRLCMMYRVAHTPVGDPWTPWLSLTFAQRTTRGSHAWKYIPISTSHDAYKFSFLPRTIIAWNQLPSIIITAPSLDAFRSRLITSQP